MQAAKLIEIFKNFGFQVISDTVFGNVIEMTSEDAFVFSATTGAKYLFYENGITMKGRNEVFIHRAIFSNNHLIYSPGLFLRTIDGYLKEGNSADYLLQRFPCVFAGNKKIIIYDIIVNQTSNIERKIYNQIKSAGLDVNDYVLYKNFLSNNVGESLQEYFASLYFINKGYLVENQVPWFQQNYKYKGHILQGGIPDFSAFNGSISNLLYKYNFIDEDKGLHLCEIPVLKLFRKKLFYDTNKIDKTYNYSLFIGEAKTSAHSFPQALKQLEKYNAVNLAKQLFTIIPDYNNNDNFGSMFINDSYNVVYNPGKIKSVDEEQTLVDDKWISTYIKMLLLGNLDFKDIVHFISTFREKHSFPIATQYQSTHLLDAVQNTSDDEFFKFCKETLNGLHK